VLTLVSYIYQQCSQLCLLSTNSAHTCEGDNRVDKLWYSI